ncbi:Fatty acid amide hydrolase (AtFAAH) (N-acylethanolamine amidohydrolase) [Durusdinium trenchii]|uniref:Fatty acid amide hydrolase (AtFAAH) (N-acylethanolamine amidohydrolase) n=1 Tax=Durusdinium trenchii TaxID=1381693 RepID=A0ABP0RXD6_9DINO
MRLSTAVKVGAVSAVFGGILLALDEHEIDPVDPTDTSYDLVDAKAPAVDGTLLKIFSWLTTKTPFGVVILKVLLNDNGFHHVRSLAAQLPDVAPMYYPMRRLPSTEYAKHEDAAKSIPSILANGLGQHEFKGEKYFGIDDYHELYKSGGSTPSQAMKKVLAAIEQAEKELRMFSSLLPDDVMEQAAAADARWKAGKPRSVLDGVPVAVKDMIEVLGHPIFDGGSESVQSKRDDSIVRRLRDLGAIIIGVTVMTEGGVTPLGYNAHFDGPKNPYNKEYYTGGSSSGSGVVVAAGLIPVAVGFDGGGSVRVPSSMSGIFGLAVTFARIPFEFEGLSSTMIKSGPMAASAKDAAIAYAALASNFPKDHFYADLYDGGNSGPPPPRLDGFDKIEDLSDVRIGVFWEHFNDADPEIVAACKAALEFAKSRGATLVDIRIPHLRAMNLAHAQVILSEFALMWDKRYHSGTKIEANTRITVALGKTFTANDVVSAQRIRAWAFDIMKNKIFAENNLDMIASPTSAVPVPKVPPGASGVGENNNELVFQVMKFIPLANLCGLPSMNVPAGYDKDGMPIGFQLLGDHWQEHRLLRVAHALEVGHLVRKKPLAYFAPEL